MANSVGAKDIEAEAQISYSPEELTPSAFPIIDEMIAKAQAERKFPEAREKEKAVAQQSQGAFLPPSSFPPFPHSLPPFPPSLQYLPPSIPSSYPSQTQGQMALSFRHQQMNAM